MARAELIHEGAPRRATLADETARALEILDLALGASSPMDAAIRAAIEKTCEEVRRTLERADASVALVGDRTSNALLDAVVGRPLFGSAGASGEGPLVVVRAAETAVCRAVLRGGSVEELELPELTREPEPGPAVERVGFLRSLFQKIAAILRALFKRREPALAAPGSVDGASRLRDMIDPRGRGRDVEELWLTLPTVGLPDWITLYDMRGVVARAGGALDAFARARIDVAVLVVEASAPESVSDAARTLARELSSRGSRLLVATTLPAADVALALQLDPGRFVRLPPSLGARELQERVLVERELRIVAHTSAAIRLAQRGIEEAMERDRARDREAIARLESYRTDPGRQPLEPSAQGISGAIAGRAIRILQSVLSSFEAELASLREERLRLASAARSLDDLRAVARGVGGGLGALRGTLALEAERLLEDAVRHLGPPLLEEFSRRVELVLRDVELATPGRPAWPPLPKITLEGGLVAEAALRAGAAFDADIGWADSFLRSFDKVKERCVQQLATELDRLSEAAHVEILDSEPTVARSLSEGLEAWLDLVRASFARWLEATIRAERAARDSIAAERQRGWAALRDSLEEHGRAMSARFR